MAAMGALSIGLVFFLHEVTVAIGGCTWTLFTEGARRSEAESPQLNHRSLHAIRLTCKRMIVPGDDGVRLLS